MAYFIGKIDDCGGNGKNLKKRENYGMIGHEKEMQPTAAFPNFVFFIGV